MIIRKLSSCVGVVIVLVFAVACSNTPKKDLRKLVSVSIVPQEYMVRKLADTLLQVQVLIPPGANHSTYSLLPSQMQDLAGSRLWLQVGPLSLEKTWAEKIKANNPGMKIVDCSEGVELLSGTDEHHDAGHDHEGGIDPHIWMSPHDVKIMAGNMLRALSETFPSYAGVFETNYVRFLTEVDSLHNQIAGKLNGLENRKFLIFHPALGYFSREFGLEQIPLELEGKEPSPRYMKEIVDIARTNNIKTVFIQQEFDSENALQLSREIGGNVVQINPMDANWPGQLQEIADKLVLSKQ